MDVAEFAKSKPAELKQPFLVALGKNKIQITISSFSTVLRCQSATMFWLLFLCILGAL